MGRVHVLSERHATAVSYFQAALRADPMLWAAFEALCTLGAEPEAEAYLRSTAVEPAIVPDAGWRHTPAAQTPLSSEDPSSLGPSAATDRSSTGLTSRLRTSLDFASPAQSWAAPGTPGQPAAASPGGFSFQAPSTRAAAHQTPTMLVGTSATPVGGLATRLATPASSASSTFITPSPAGPVMPGMMLMREDDDAGICVGHGANLRHTLPFLISPLNELAVD